MPATQILTPAEIAALRVLAKRHIRRSHRPAESLETSGNVARALDKLATLTDGYPARIASCGLRRLEIHDPEQASALDQRLNVVRDELERIATDYGVSDPGAANPGELLWELEDAALMFATHP